MENASKALLIAASILLSVLILSLIVYLFVTFGASASRTHDQVAEQQMVQFNSQFTIYADRKDLKIHDIITVANLAKENNEANKGYDDFENTYKITIIVNDEINDFSNRRGKITIPKSNSGTDRYDGIETLNSYISEDIAVYKSSDGN